MFETNARLTARGGPNLDCDRRPVRTLQTQWTQQFPWLLNDFSHKKMYCTQCKAIYVPFGRDSRHKATGIPPSKYTRYAAGPMVIGYNHEGSKKDNLVSHQTT